ncbi:MAG TPA: CYTH domain-containing protein [Gaiellales bacterium]|nr:CYTH domain-containing protein [Gaiellales bacterium]
MTPAPFSPPSFVPTAAGFEVERQWRAHPSLRLPLALGEWRAVDDRSERLVDHYYDTADLELDRQRARLRLRTADALELATLKRRVTSRAGLRRRVEIEGPCHGDPETSVAFVAARLLTLHPLVEIGRIVTARHARVYARGERTVEVVRDQVSYPVGEDEWRLEAEGDPGDVREIGGLLDRLPLGLAPVGRGKVRTLLQRSAA